MARFGNQMCTFTWHIENFSMCPQQIGEWIESPEFVVDFLENTKWIMSIYPRGIIDQNYVSVYLERVLEFENEQEIDVLWGLAAISTFEGKNIEWGMLTNTFGPDDYWGYSDFWARDEIFKQESGLLPNDTLTLRCQMCRGVEEQESKAVVFKELKTDYWNCNTAYECSARTRIKVSSASFVWSIKWVGELSSGVKLSTSVQSVFKSQPSFDFLMYKDPEEGKNFCIEIRRKKANKVGFFVRCHIRTVGVPRRFQFEGQDEHYVKAGEQDVWIFPTFIKIKDLAESYIKHIDGALYLQFELSFSNVKDVFETENTSKILHQDFATERQKPLVSTSTVPKLYIDGEFADAALRVDEREFKVHKLILMSESDVFRRMFDSGMKEEQNGAVDIEDLGADTVERLLKYMYTHELEELNPEDVIKLYYAAYKYNVEDLKCRLRSILIASLTANSVCETLILADLHHDEDLIESVFDFVSRNNTEVFHSHNWEDFVKTHAELAAITMFRFLMKGSPPEHCVQSCHISL